MAWWMVPAAISAGSKLIGHFAGQSGRNKQKRAYRDLTSLGEEFRNFDPMSYAKEAAQAQWDMLQTPLSEAIGDLRAGQEERGGGIGFATEGEDRMVRDVYQNFMQGLSAQAMEGGRMRLGAMQNAGDVYASRYDIGARDEDKAWKKWGGLGRDIGSAYLWSKSPGWGG